MAAPQLVDRQPHQVEIDGETLAVRVRASSTAGTVRLRLGPNHPLEIIAPEGTSEEYIAQVLRDRRPWIRRKLAAARAIERRPAALGLDQAGVVWLDLRPIPVRHHPHRPAGARLADGVLIVGGEHEQVASAIDRWYRREARQRLLDLANHEAQRLGLAYRSLSVRDQRTRWGSCSSSGNLSFNWRLVIAPAHVRRYVVVHELCHLRVPNHSKTFWLSLDGACPGWHTSAAWLREHGQELHRYSPTATA